ncbi:hypothetical protein HDU82_004175, partial [Entophlyctis luteolus]
MGSLDKMENLCCFCNGFAETRTLRALNLCGILVRWILKRVSVGGRLWVVNAMKVDKLRGFSEVDPESFSVSN